jgi:hypothetical protein
MSGHNTHTMQVLWDNTLLIFSGVFGWVLTAVGVDHSHLGLIFTGEGWEIVDYIFNHAAIFLSCAVSLATLFKINKELKKK